MRRELQKIELKNGFKGVNCHTELNMCILQGCFNFCPSLIKFEKISLWISLMVFSLPQEKQLFLLQLIIYLITPISMLYLIFIQLLLSLNFFCVGCGFLRGMPLIIINNCDSIFISQFWEEYFQLQGSSLCRISFYHPQTNGQIKVVNHSFEGYLRCFDGHQSSTWTNKLPQAGQWDNTTFHSAIKMNPLEIANGPPPT